MPKIETMLDALITIGGKFAEAELDIPQAAYVRWKQDVYYHLITTYGTETPNTKLIQVDNASWEGETSGGDMPDRRAGAAAVVAVMSGWEINS
jgi:hypothetical protein